MHLLQSFTQGYRRLCITLICMHVFLLLLLLFYFITAVWQWKWQPATTPDAKIQIYKYTMHVQILCHCLFITHWKKTEFSSIESKRDSPFEHASNTIQGKSGGELFCVIPIFVDFHHFHRVYIYFSIDELRSPIARLHTYKHAHCVFGSPAVV